jgi:uncharacterized protein
MIVVFDTSVWISAMHFERRHGTPVLALEHARNQDTIAICDEIQEEIFRILAEKFEWEPAAIRYRLNFLLARSLTASITGRMRVCRDPNDDMVLECAVLAGAHVVVAGDRDLLVLGPYRGIRILTPAEYLALRV